MNLNRGRVKVLSYWPLTFEVLTFLVIYVIVFNCAVKLSIDWLAYLMVGAPIFMTLLVVMHGLIVTVITSGAIK